MVWRSWLYPALTLCRYSTCEYHYSCKGSRCNLCVCYTHAILPKGAKGRNFNTCCHVRRIEIYNPALSDEMFTTQGLRVRFNEKGLERLRKKYNSKALKLMFSDKMQWCDCALQFICCPCRCCTCECCPETKAYDLLVADEAFVDGDDNRACLGVRGTTCCLLIPFIWLYAAIFSCLCENTIRVHHIKYELVDHEGDFIAPTTSTWSAAASRGQRVRGAAARKVRLRWPKPDSPGTGSHAHGLGSADSGQRHHAPHQHPAKQTPESYHNSNQQHRAAELAGIWCCCRDRALGQKPILGAVDVLLERRVPLVGADVHEVVAKHVLAAAAVC